MGASSIAGRFELPYYVVVFTSQRTDVDAEGYNRTAARMETLARQQPGFLGIETARGADGVGITASYWQSREAIAAWKWQVEHLSAQASGRDRWYACYRLRIARVETDYGFPSLASDATTPP